MYFADFYHGKTFDACKFFSAPKHGQCIIFCACTPNPKNAFVVGDFNSWQPEEMCRKHGQGAYVLQIMPCCDGQML